jgi:hypothetical protein
VIPISIESSRRDESRRTTIQCSLIAEIEVKEAVPNHDARQQSHHAPDVKDETSGSLSERQRMEVENHRSVGRDRLHHR